MLLNLSAWTDDNQSVQINATGSITETGDILLEVSKYDPTKISFLQLTVVPILPDRAFEVQWDELPEGAAWTEDRDLPEFDRCKTSPMLQQRYAACNSLSTAWPSQPISIRISRWFSKLEASFLVRTANKTELALWGAKRIHKLQVQFSDVDSPAGWAARDYGCKLLDKPAA